MLQCLLAQVVRAVAGSPAAGTCCSAPHTSETEIISAVSARYTQENSLLFDLQAGKGRAAEHLALLATATVDGRVTSLSLDPSSSAAAPGAPPATTFLAYVGTAAGNIYQALVDVRGKSVTPQLVQSAHSSAITSVAFPRPLRRGALARLRAFCDVCSAMGSAHQ